MYVAHRERTTTIGDQGVGAEVEVEVKGRTMFFLLRMTFWIGLVMMLMPSGAKHITAVTRAGVSAGDALSTASSNVSDMRRFCSHQPTACTIGSQAAITFGQRAQAGAKKISDFLTERTAPRQTAPTASKSAKAAGPVNAKASQDTLSAGDAAPAWRGSHHEVHLKNGA